MLPIIEEKNGKDEEQSKAEHSDATPSILVTSPWCSLIHHSPRPSRTRSLRDQRMSRRTCYMRARSQHLRGRGKATKKSNTSEIARLKQAWSIASRCKNADNKASMQATILVQDIETGDNWKWARQDSGPLPLLKQALEALQEHAKQLFSGTCWSRTTHRRYCSFLELRWHKCSQILIVSREFRSTVTQSRLQLRGCRQCKPSWSSRCRCGCQSVAPCGRERHTKHASRRKKSGREGSPRKTEEQSRDEFRDEVLEPTTSINFKKNL